MLNNIKLMIGWTESKPIEIKRGISILGLKWDMVIDISNNLFRDLVQKIKRKQRRTDSFTIQGLLLGDCS